MGVNDYRRVEIEADPRDHVIKLGMFNDGTGKALCGRKPFPERWAQPVLPSDAPLCAGCQQAVRNGK